MNNNFTMKNHNKKLIQFKTNKPLTIVQPSLDLLCKADSNKPKGLPSNLKTIIQ